MPSIKVRVEIEGDDDHPFRIVLEETAETDQGNVFERIMETLLEYGQFYLVASDRAVATLTPPPDKGSDER